MKPTEETYAALNAAYRRFNARLFGDRLPECVIVFQRKKNSRGYFWGEIWSEAAGNRAADELALNPDFLQERSLAETLSTLVHEMCHVEQHHFGKPSRSGYHNKEWGEMMERVGLIPSDTGAPGGKKTGQKMTHYVDAEGPFAREVAELLAEGFVIPWTARRPDPLAAKKAASKTKYCCETCEVSAWAKPDVRIVCGDCGERMEAAA